MTLQKNLGTLNTRVGNSISLHQAMGTDHMTAVLDRVINNNSPASCSLYVKVSSREGKSIIIIKNFPSLQDVGPKGILPVNFLKAVPV